MMKSIIIILILLLSLQTSCMAETATDTYVVSLIRLLVLPTPFENRRVAVIGFLEDNSVLRLYLTSDHAHIPDIESSIQIFDTSKNAELYHTTCPGHYVDIVGKLIRIKKNSEEFGLTDVQRIVVLDHNKIGQCWPPIAKDNNRTPE